MAQFSLCLGLFGALLGGSLAMSVIGTGRSQATLTLNETSFFEHTMDNAATGYLNHFWAAGSPTVDRAIFRYYIDGEARASIVFSPALACGVGFGDQTAPWGNRWIGKGARSTGWFHNIPIPFHSSIRVTFQLNPIDHLDGGLSKIWTIVRGSVGVPLRLGNLDLPVESPSLRLELQVKEAVVLSPLEFMDMATVGAGKQGTIFLSSLFVNGSSNYNYMEGCFHLYTPPNTAWPGLLLSTGMEDYYDSAFYFDGGGFHFPVSGETHKPGDGTFSGYRLHEMDPLVFQDGVRFQWRNGDVTDPQTGLKCTLHTGGATVGNPGNSTVTSYVWLYTW